MDLRADVLANATAAAADAKSAVWVVIRDPVVTLFALS